MYLRIFILFLLLLDSNSTEYITNQDIIKCVEEFNNYGNPAMNIDTIKKEHDLGETELESQSFSQQSNCKSTMDANSKDIFRSMKINDASKTPYSDATQVRHC